MRRRSWLIRHFLEFDLDDLAAGKISPSFFRRSHGDPPETPDGFVQFWKFRLIYMLGVRLEHEQVLLYFERVLRPE